MRALVLVVALGGCDHLLNLQPVTTPPTPPVFAQGQTSIAAGQGFSCWIHSDGALYCWGENDDGELGLSLSALERDTPARVGDATWLAIAAGDYHACGIESDGSLWCWGADFYGELGDGGSTNQIAPTAVPGTWTAVATGVTHTCAIAGDGTLSCWGDNSLGQLGDGTQLPHATPAALAGTWKHVCAGDGHTCAIAADDSLWCWGDNGAGELGDGTNVDKLSPVMSGNDTWSDIACGRFHTCGQTTTGHVRCWGENEFGELGIGNTTYQPSAVAVFADGVDRADWIGVTASGNHTCAWTRTNEAYCWGESSRGEVGQDGSSSNPLPLAVDGGPWSAVGSGVHHVCMLDTADALWCRGANGWGQLGIGGASHDIPTAALSSGAWSAVYAGMQTTCVRATGPIGTSGSVPASCGGDNGTGELGLGNLTSQRVLAPLTGYAWTGLALGDFQTCGIDDRLQIQCWGNDRDGEAGLGGTGAYVMTPEAPTVPGSVDYQFDLVTASDHGCAVGTNAGYATCWGPNDSGQIGNPSGADVLMPSTAINKPGTMPPPNTSWSRIAAGGQFTCALDTASGPHQAWCWGLNDAHHYQLGDGAAETMSAVPVPVSGSALFYEISAGRYHTCAIDDLSAAWCWGYNGEGQLGNVDYAEHKMPVAVKGGLLWDQISAGGYHTCGVATDTHAGELWCWGDNRRGQLGNGDPARATQSAPVRVGNDSDWVAVAAGTYHTCGVRGTALFCWGSNDDGQLLDGTGWSTVPVMVQAP